MLEGERTLLEIKKVFYLPHDFNDVNLEISYPAVYEKYERRINRLLNKLKASFIVVVCFSREGGL